MNWGKDTFDNMGDLGPVAYGGPRAVIRTLSVSCLLDMPQYAVCGVKQGVPVRKIGCRYETQSTGAEPWLFRASVYEMPKSSRILSCSGIAVLTHGAAGCAGYRSGVNL